jgi:Tfp pilus assembly protein PilF
MFRYTAILTLALTVAAALPIGAQAQGALSPDGSEGRRLLLRQRWEPAAEAFQRAVDRGRATAAELEGLGCARMRLGQFSRAAEVYRSLCAQYPDKAPFWLNLGLAYVYQKPARLDEAESAFRRALKLRPHDPVILNNLAVSLHKNGRPREALPLAQEAAGTAPAEAYVLTELADILRDLGDRKGAYEAYQRALARDHSWPPTLLGLARLYYACSFYMDAMRYGYDFLTHTDGEADLERWADERSAAQILIEQAKERLRTTAPPHEDTEAPQITLLLPRLSPEQLADRRLALRVDREQIGIVGLVEDDQGINQVTINGVNSEFLRIKPEAIGELKKQGQQHLLLDKELILDKKLILDPNLIVDLHDKGRAGARPSYLFQGALPLILERDTPVHIAAWDFAGHITSLEFTIRRPRRPETHMVVRPTRSPGNVWALFIGVNRYPHLSGASSLHYAASDTQHLYDLMCDPSRGGIDPTHAFLLHDNREADEEKPTRANIARRIEEMRKLIQPTDTVLFFFSGHGAVRGGNTYLLTRDADPARLEETALSRTALNDMPGSLPARRIILFLDGCHAAGVEGDATGANPLAGQPYRRLLHELSRQQLLFASCEADQLAYDDLLGLEGSVFGHYFAEGLAGRADANKDGVVTLNEVVDYVESEVRGWCRATLAEDDKPQRPVRLPSGWRVDLPLTFDPLQIRIEAARAAMKQMSTHLSSAELRQAEADLRSGPDRAVVSEWLLELNAAGSPSSTPVTWEQYRTYRRLLDEEPGGLRARLYRLLMPQQALAADAHLVVPGEEGKVWRSQTERAVRGELSIEDFLDWMDDRLQQAGPQPQR